MNILPRFRGAPPAIRAWQPHRFVSPPPVTRSPGDRSYSVLGADRLERQDDDRGYPGQPPTKRAERWLQRFEETVGDGLVLASRVPALAKLGYHLYGAATKPKTDVPTVDNLSQVTDGLWRGGQPTGAGFETLAAQGVQTVINLRPEATWEAPMVRAAGMRYLYMPLPAVGAPTQEQALAFLSAATDPAHGRVFFHCQHGADRTGAMAAAYRIAAEGWPVERAIAEMYRNGLHAGFEDDKVDFVLAFARSWARLEPARQREVLHR